MAIESDDILLKLSIKTASSGNSDAQADPDESLGGFMSSTEVVNSGLHELFDVVSGDENLDEDVEYRCLFVHNNHESLTLTDPKVWIVSEVSGGADISIGLDPTEASVATGIVQQAVSIEDEGTEPSGVTFSEPTEKDSGLSLGDLDTGECRAIWIRRTATDSEAKNNDGFTIRIEGDTEA